jgi:hypothetical protein
MTYPEALIWTYVLETPVVMAAGWFLRREIRRAVLAALLASSLSHPLAWWVATSMSPEDSAWGWYAIEAAVCCAEAPVLGRIIRLPSRWAWPLSITANAVSALVGRFVL